MKEPEPPDGYRRARAGKRRKPGYLYWEGSFWEHGKHIGRIIKDGESPIANPIKVKTEKKVYRLKGLAK